MPVVHLHHFIYIIQCDYSATLRHGVCKCVCICWWYLMSNLGFPPKIVCIQISIFVFFIYNDRIWLHITDVKCAPCMFFHNKSIREDLQECQNIRIYVSNSHFEVLTSRFNQLSYFTKQQEFLQLWKFKIKLLVQCAKHVYLQVPFTSCMCACVWEREREIPRFPLNNTVKCSVNQPSPPKRKELHPASVVSVNLPFKDFTSRCNLDIQINNNSSIS